VTGRRARLGLAAVAVAVAATLASLAAGQAQAETIVSGLNRNSVAITADFTGSDLLIYGAVRRDAPPPDGPPLEVIVTVEGPSAPLILRRKERVNGIWINNAQVRIDRAPSFYVVTTTGPLSRILSETENIRHRIRVPNAIRAVGISAEAEAAQQFVEALIRLRTEAGAYGLRQGAVTLTEDTLFRADVALPANLTEGEYKVRMFLTRAGRVVAVQERLVGVRKAGLERLIFNAAQEQPALYGLFAILMAAGAGWAASALFRLIRS
jgi:uncharacterized protein (TIGR02186 family)